MTSKWIPSVAALLLLPTWLLAAEPQTNTEAEDTPWLLDGGPVFTDGQPVADGEPMFLARGQTPRFAPNIALRSGYWGVDTDGSPVKTGEYQDLDSFGFWNADGLLSDGRRTLDFYATGLDREGNQAGLYFYNPIWSSKVEYDRYLRRLDFDPYLNFPASPANPPADPDVPPLVVNQKDGFQDNAIRVQELDAKFKGKITDNLSWRLELWGMRKEGERQQAAMAHCYVMPLQNPPPASARVCHAESQSQSIDWLTTEIKPVIEARFGDLTAEYSRTMRSFSQDDEHVFRNYNTSHAPWSLQGDQEYAVVPDNFTQIDKLKLRYEFTDTTDAYVNMLVGDTHNKFSDITRSFHGIDARITNRSIDGLTLVGYSKWFVENTGSPGVFNGYDYQGDLEPEDTFKHPISHARTTAGVKAQWQPGRRKYSSSGLSLTSGYEYSLLARDWSDLYLTPSSAAGAVNPPLIFSQGDTESHMVHSGASYRWSRQFDTFVRVKARTYDNPLLGASERMWDLNTNQPDDEYRVEIGGTWMPSENFLLSATFGVEQRVFDLLYTNNNPELQDAIQAGRVPDINPIAAYFDEDDYPMVLSAWYAPTDKVSLSAGYSRLTNWINQGIRLGDAYDDGINNPAAHNEVEADPVTTPWRYAGVAQVISLGSSYAYSRRVTLRTEFEWVRGRNTYVSPSPATALDADGNVIIPDWSTLPSGANVIVETTKYEAGIDYWLRDNISCYFVYNYFDYDGKTPYEQGNSGTAHLFLGGMTAMF